MVGSSDRGSGRRRCRLVLRGVDQMIWLILVGYVYLIGLVITAIYGISIGMLSPDDGLSLWLRWVSLLVPAILWPLFWIGEWREAEK